jgi:hypothetical protein
MKLPPRTLYITDVRFGAYGNEITFECLYDQVGRKPLHLIFKGCHGIEWEPYLPSNGDVEVRGILLGREQFWDNVRVQERRATVRTTAFVARFAYDEIKVNKIGEWA